MDGVLFIPADIGTSAGADSIVSRLTADWSGLDMLVSNAGGVVETKPGGFESLSDADWQAILDLNLIGPTRLDRAFVPGMIERGSGVIIHIGSVAARLPFAHTTLAYAAAKAAFATYSKGLAKGVAPHGVRVTMISPGLVETSGAQGMIADIVRNTGASEAAARQQIVDMLGGIPVGRPGIHDVGRSGATTRMRRAVNSAFRRSQSSAFRRDRRSTCSTRRMSPGCASARSLNSSGRLSVAPLSFSTYQAAIVRPRSAAKAGS